MGSGSRCCRSRWIDISTYKPYVRER
ncbi:unnamed protein product [Euphydryas editha]|uniref:Uncharacterized protein n=1 Tax=Euphydryas editha TaxID=104508 RepID=A0AAU9VCU9_EUPED|nr:unnamed protein product [Euphydryas editha]